MGRLYEILGGDVDVGDPPTSASGGEGGEALGGVRVGPGELARAAPGDPPGEPARVSVEPSVSASVLALR